MFSLKKFLAPLFSPLSVCVELMAFGLVLLVFSRKQKTGKFFVVLGMVVLVMCSYEGVSGRILRTLESQYPPLQVAELMPYKNGGVGDTICKVGRGVGGWSIQGSDVAHPVANFPLFSCQAHGRNPAASSSPGQ